MVFVYYTSRNRIKGVVEIPDPLYPQIGTLKLQFVTFCSWRVGRVVPVIRSAVRTTLCSLLRSDLVAKLNQTVIEVQRMIQWWQSRTVSAAPVAG